MSTHYGPHKANGYKPRLVDSLVERKLQDRQHKDDGIYVLPLSTLTA